MAHYFFQAQYHGATLTDDLGEEFSTPHEAEAHAAVVTNELRRNISQAETVTVSVLSEDGKQPAPLGIAKTVAPSPSRWSVKRPIPSWQRPNLTSRPGKPYLVAVNRPRLDAPED